MGMVMWFDLASEQQLADIEAVPDRLFDLLYPTEPKYEELNIDKSWHALHYVLCGSVVPGDTLLSMAVFGQNEIDCEMDYGKPRSTHPDDIPAVLSQLNEFDLSSAIQALDLDSTQLDDIYLGQEILSGNVTELQQTFDELKRIYAKAHAQHCGLVMHLA